MGGVRVERSSTCQRLSRVPGRAAIRRLRSNITVEVVCFLIEGLMVDRLWQDVRFAARTTVEDTGLHARRHRDARARHRREHRDLLARPIRCCCGCCRCKTPSSSSCSTDPVPLRDARSTTQHLLVPDVSRLPRSQQVVRRRDGAVSDASLTLTRQRPGRAGRTASWSPATTSTCSACRPVLGRALHARRRPTPGGHPVADAQLRLLDAPLRAAIPAS